MLDMLQCDFLLPFLLYHPFTCSPFFIPSSRHSLDSRHFWASRHRNRPGGRSGNFPYGEFLGILVFMHEYVQLLKEKIINIPFWRFFTLVGRWFLPSTSLLFLPIQFCRFPLAQLLHLHFWKHFFVFHAGTGSFAAFCVDGRQCGLFLSPCIGLGHSQELDLLLFSHLVHKNTANEFCWNLWTKWRK